MLGRQLGTTFIFACIISCTPSRQESTVNEIAGPDTTVTVSQSDSVITLNQHLFHPPHEEDRHYPWYDTRYAGGWIKEQYLDSLMEIFVNDTTRSLYEYTKSIDQCNEQLLMVEIEGCAKERLFYLKNSGCNDEYISKSNFEVGEQNKFMLVNIVSGSTYQFESTLYNELYVDGDRFVNNDDYLSKFEQKLNGIYRVFNNAGLLLDTVNYRRGAFEKSDTLSNMNLVSLTYINSKRNVKPTLDHSDLVYVRYYTGDSSRTELVDDSGAGMGSYETIPKLEYIEYDLKRTSKGFELHNAYDNDKRGFIAEGLVLRFEKIAEVEKQKMNGLKASQ